MHLQKIGLTALITLLTSSTSIPVDSNQRVLLGVTLDIQTLSAQETKISQCKQMVAIANEVVEGTQNIFNGENDSELERLLRVSQQMDDAAAKMDKLSLNDPTLRNLKSQFVSMYRQISKALGNFVGAFQAQNRPAAEFAQQELLAAISQEKQLLTEFNGHCGSESAQLGLRFKPTLYSQI